VNADLGWMPAWELRDRLAAGGVSVVEAAAWFLDRIERLDAGVHAFITIARENALAQARALERRRAEGEPPGPLYGVPVSLKDNLQTRGIRTTAGSRLYEDHVPAEDSVHAERICGAGGIIVGKTNLPEFAVFPRTVNRLTAECLNPWDAARTCGGSSGGAAASVAAGMTPLAVGTDGGGSIRIPAALCGVCGLHPSRGRVPRHGGIAGHPLFSGVGPIARTVRDAALLLAVLAGPDPRDPAALPDPPPDYLAGLEDGVRGLRMRWVDRPSPDAAVDPAVVAQAERAAGRLAALGAAVEPAGGTFGIDEWFDAFYTIMDVDRYAALGQALYEDPSTRGRLSAYARDHFARARTITAVEYARALAARRRAIPALYRLFDDADVVLSPTVGIVAPEIAGPIARPPLVGYTFLVNFTGFTAMTVPCGLVRGLPAGLQIIGRPNAEALVLRVARALEQAQPWPDLRGGAPVRP
jgi:Asp-tRNA(Asn)/Glu-tRNA(Gln) amidotransferase A subunit family amidase